MSTDREFIKKHPKYQQKAYCFHINKAVKDCRLHPPQYCRLGSYFKHSPFTCRYMWLGNMCRCDNNAMDVVVPLTLSSLCWKCWSVDDDHTMVVMLTSWGTARQCLLDVIMQANNDVVIVVFIFIVSRIKISLKHFLHLTIDNSIIVLLKIQHEFLIHIHELHPSVDIPSPT